MEEILEENRTLESIINFENYKVDREYKYFILSNPSSSYYGSLGFYNAVETDNYLTICFLKDGLITQSITKENFKRDCTLLTDEQLSKYSEEIGRLKEIAKFYEVYLYITNNSEELFEKANSLSVEFKSSLTEDYLKSLYENFYKKASEVEKLTQEVFGADNVCMVYDEKLSTFSANILFEEVNITNTAKHHHLIKNLVVKIPFTYNKKDNIVKVTTTISGTRLTNSYSEIRNGYKHSHLPGNSNSQAFNTFCLGATDVHIINADLMVAFTEAKYLLFLNMLPAYVGWESLEGGPYKRMAKISTGDNDYYINSDATNIISDISYNKFLDFNLSFDIPNKRFKVLRDNKLEKQIVDILNQDGYKYSSIKSCCYCFRDVNNQETFGRDSATNVVNEIKRLNSNIRIEADILKLKFKNIKDPKLVIYNDFVENDQGLVLSKQVVDRIALALEEKLNNHIKLKK